MTCLLKLLLLDLKEEWVQLVVEMVKGDDELTLAALFDPFATKKKWTVFLSSQIKRIGWL